MEVAASKQHAHPNTVFHCLYGYFYLGYSRKDLAHIYNKTRQTISNWIREYETSGTYERSSSKSDKKFTVEQREWIRKFFERRPLAYLDEAQGEFHKHYHLVISKTSVWRIIHDFGLTWKVLERRAIHIKERDIFRFAEELSHINWCHQNIVFLDEVSFDNRGMLRKRGYALRGQKVAIRGEFQRKPRVSLLAFIGANGIIDYYDTEGTFDRAEFVRCCQDFAYSRRSGVRPYPSSNSVWILDGAAIHRHPEIVHYLRSIGIVLIFLPAYCPFFNPIEFLFGYVKKAFQRHYVESSDRDLKPFIVDTFRRFENFNMTRVFEHCGWMVEGVFNPVGPLSSERQPVPDIMQPSTEQEEDLDEDDLGFHTLS